MLCSQDRFPICSILCRWLCQLDSLQHFNLPKYFLSSQCTVLGNSIRHWCRLLQDLELCNQPTSFIYSTIRKKHVGTAVSTHVRWGHSQTALWGGLAHVVIVLPVGHNLGTMARKWPTSLILGLGLGWKFCIKSQKSYWNGNWNHSLPFP